jgi:N-acetyl sugar amidotransferase
MGEYKICKRCLMDTSAEEIYFDEQGNCQFCNDFLKRLDNLSFFKTVENSKDLTVLIEKVKRNGLNKPYDCIVGLSGGLDSSWVLVQAVKAGLRPLAVHMDNGWNSELAQNNIECLVKKLDVDLFTYVIDWEEYRDLQEAFFDADVVDIELLYDNALAAINFKLARKYSLKYILSGSNTATEGVEMPREWAAQNKYDFQNIINIWKKFGKGYKLKSFPGYNFEQHLIDYYVKKIRWVPFLNYFNYNKKEAILILSNEYGFVPYPYKHYESVFTRFYQGYILPNKFGYDKRRNHLSALILTNQITRDEAFLILCESPYGLKSDENTDKDYFLKKFSWTIDKLEEYIKRPGIKHHIYGGENYKWDLKRKVALAFKFLFKN